MTDSKKMNSKNDVEKKSYEVGYGKPPEQHQFKKGVSGYPSGRKRKPTSIEGLTERELNTLIEIKENGRIIRVTKREAIVKRLVNSALNGAPRSIDYLIKFCTQHGISDPLEVTPKDRTAVLEALERSRTGGGSAKRRPSPPEPQTPTAAGPQTSAENETEAQGTEVRPWTYPKD